MKELLPYKLKTKYSVRKGKKDNTGLSSGPFKWERGRCLKVGALEINDENFGGLCLPLSSAVFTEEVES